MVSRWSVVRMCCNRWGAQWPGLIFEVTYLRSMAVVVTEASITGRFRKKRRAYKDQSSSLLLKLLKGPSSFMLAAYIVFELRSDQHDVIPPYIPRIRRCRRSPLLSTSLVIVPSSFEMALPAFPLATALAGADNILSLLPLEEFLRLLRQTVDPFLSRRHRPLTCEAISTKKITFQPYTSFAGTIVRVNHRYLFYHQRTLYLYLK